MASETTLLVMAKAPVAGRVKTRLCPPCTPDEAAAIAEAALADTLDAVARSGAGRRVLALDGEPGPWLPPGFEVVSQRGSTFADRLEHAWSTMSGPALQIGMDTPQVTPALLDDGLRRIVDGVDAAIGRATDGGWWALALRRPLPGLFDDVPMSTGATGVAQIDAIRRRGIEPALLDELRDIDSIDDALVVAAGMPGSRTASCVAEITERTPR